MAKSQSKKDNPMTMISLRLPEDMVVALKKVAPLVGEAGYQPLIRTYIEQGLAKDLEKIEGSKNTKYQDDETRSEATQESRTISEERAEYIIDRSPEFVVGPPLEWSMAINEVTEDKTWGEDMVALLNSISETGWEDIDDPVEWVDNARKRRREDREKLL